MNELRRDYFLDRWVIISTERARRPTDFARHDSPEPTSRNDTKAGGSCSFCPGAELKTPPSKASYFLNDSHLYSEPDVAGEPREGWIVRVIPNMYPAVEPGLVHAISETEVSASGMHEVIVESPVHDRHPQFMGDEEIKRLFTVYRDRFKAISEAPYVKYISLFRNYGKDSGASLSHTHSQIISLPIVPPVISEQFGLDYGKVVEAESQGPRLILESEHTVAFAPFASCYTYEAWVFPKRPCRNIVELTEAERDDFALVARDVLARISKLLADPPYNYAFVQSPGEKMHMNLRIYPKLGVEAGFELNTRVHINSVPPEAAAKSLRDVKL
jgi:UDPglucose--hexose-1-phosphate uridylyltransferase